MSSLLGTCASIGIRNRLGIFLVNNIYSCRLNVSRIGILVAKTLPNLKGLVASLIFLDKVIFFF